MTATGQPRTANSRSATLDRRGVALACGVASLVLIGVMFADLARWVAVDGRSGGIEDALFEPERSSPLLIFGVFALLVWGRRAAIRARVIEGRGRLSLGLPLFAVAIALAAWARYVGEAPIDVYAFSLGLLAASAMLGGVPGMRSVLLPAGFLLLAIPLPGVLVNAVVYPLQGATVHGATAVLETIGVDTVELGVRFHAAGRTFQVIESCAGLRSMLTALMASIVYVEVMGADRRRGVFLVAAGVAIAFAMNVLRVVTIVLIPDQELNGDHRLQGLVAIVATMLLLAAVDGLSGRLLGRGRPGGVPASAARGRGERDGRRLVGLLCASAVGAAVVGLTPVWPEPLPGPGTLVSMPYAFAGWEGSNLKVDHEFLGSVRFDERIHRRYTREGVEVDWFVAVDRRLDPGRSLLSPKVALMDAAVAVESRSPVPPTPVHPAAEELELRTPTGRVLAWTWYRGRAGFATELARGLLALDRGPTRRPGALVAHRVATPLEGSVDSARQRLRAFLEDALPELRLGPGVAPPTGPAGVDGSGPSSRPGA